MGNNIQCDLVWDSGPDQISSLDDKYKSNKTGCF